MKLFITIILSFFAFSGTAFPDGYCIRPEKFDQDLHGWLVGEYQLIGRGYDSSSTYIGMVEISIGKKSLLIKRLIRGRHSSGTGVIEYCSPDKIPVLSIEFTERGIPIKGWCRYHAELDNYARITCLIQPANKTVKQEGQEALFFKHH
jgi:hypothetical protein